MRNRFTFQFVRLLFFLILINSNVMSQDIVSNENGCILSFGILYSSNLVSFQGKGSGELYFITGQDGVNVDSLMFSLSKKNYSSFYTILDTMSLFFKIYMIVEDRACRKKDSVNTFEDIGDDNNYGTAYMYMLNDTIKKYSTVTGYVIQRFTLRKKITFKVLGNTCNNSFPYECKVAIKRNE